MSTKTGYSITGGGGKGYINIGGWNTTLTNVSTAQAEVPGIKRREGANVYIYGKQGTLSIEGGGQFVKFGDMATDGGGTLITPVVFTVGPVGTANPFVVRAMTIQSMPAAGYGWYFVEGITTITMGTSASQAVEGFACVNNASANCFASATITQQATVLTALASGEAGLAIVKFM